MNRILSLLLALALPLTAAGCAHHPENDHTTPPPENIVSDLPQPDSNADGTTAQPLPPAQVEDKPEEPYVRIIDPSRPMVALTFDDGPHPVWSHAILDTLEPHHGVATFFELGINISSAPDALVRMLELGCEIGSHSNAHQDLSLMKQKDMLADLDTADQAFISAIGQAPTLMRPPYGAVNKAVKLGSGRSVITWNVDTEDWKSRDATTIINYVQSLEDLDGKILLLHSIYESTAVAMETLVPWLMEEGYQLVTISELFAYYYGDLLQPNQLYSHTYFNSHSRTDTPVELPDPSAPKEPVEIPVIDPEPVTPPVTTTPTTPPVTKPEPEVTPVDPPVVAPTPELPPVDTPVSPPVVEQPPTEDPGDAPTIPPEADPTPVDPPVTEGPATVPEEITEPATETPQPPTP